MAETELRERSIGAATNYLVQWQQGKVNVISPTDLVDAIFAEVESAGYVIAKLEGTVNAQDAPRMKPEPPEDVA